MLLEFLNKLCDLSAYLDTEKNPEKVLWKFNLSVDCGVQIAVGLMIFQHIGGINGVGFYASQTFVAAGMSSGNIDTIAYALIQVPIIVVGALLMDRSGRRPLLMVSNQLFLCTKDHLMWCPQLGISWLPFNWNCFSP
ncbi:hypothetical protein POM88_022870 [Heracleum sosnowskyi]|uniref:Major facilitator superfamily (MFS) profile domain-containing protein n=1 Tax=Heracleum sosnowskyi TaxID=360622 RepID=A0AAD8IJL3_9APIA|nr:hypothetical protein POM88_022870 [Heracleum sosnowskyi]